MSKVIVHDKRGGQFHVEVHFTYGECDRLPFNALRKVKATLDQVPRGGIVAQAKFNLRNPNDSANFVEILDLFGESGTFVHGSASDPKDLARAESPDEGAEVRNINEAKEDAKAKRAGA